MKIITRQELVANKWKMGYGGGNGIVELCALENYVSIVYLFSGRTNLDRSRFPSGGLYFLDRQNPFNICIIKFNNNFVDNAIN